MIRLACLTQKTTRLFGRIAWRGRLWSAVLAAGLLAGAVSSESAVLSEKAPANADAWLEAKPACVFPLACEAAPTDAAAFITALSAGLGRLAVLPPGGSVIRMESGAYPSLGRLAIDLSNSSEDDVHKPPKVNWHFTPKAFVKSARFEVSAQPLLIHGAKLQYDLTATDAELQMAQDRAGRPLLMLMGTPHGHLAATAGREAIQALCLAAAKRFAQKYHFSVQDVAVDLTTPSDRDVEVRVGVLLAGELGGSLHFTGRFNVADDLTATASNLSCEGDGAGGLIIAGLLKGGLMYYDGKTKPLVVFPFGGLHLRDVKFHMGESLEIAADFGDKN